MIDAGKAYNAANRQFVSGIRELAQQSTTDEVIEVNQQDDVTQNNLLKVTCLYSNTVFGTVQGVFIYLQRFTIIGISQCISQTEIITMKPQIK